MSGLFGSVTIPGNRLTDIAQQTSSVGQPIPFGYGRFLVDGNIIWTAGKPTEHVKKKKQGKGGVKTEEYTYTLSYAIAFCAGPIYGYFTIFRDGKVVFTTDPNAAIEDKDFAAKWAQKCTMYFGTREQMPDSTIEAKQGAGKVSAFRDLAYIVVEDDDVTGNGGAVPQYAAVVIASPPEVYMTSRPYPLDNEDNLFVTSWPLNGDLRLGIYTLTPNDGMTVTAIPLAAELRFNLDTIDTPFDEMTVSAMPLSGDLRSNLVTLKTPNDAMTVSAVPTGGELKLGLVTYNRNNDAMTVSAVPLSGVLST